MTMLLLAACREANEWDFTEVATWEASPEIRTALETLARASTFKTSVHESHKMQRISVSWRNGEKRENVSMSNETYVWNLRR